MLDGGSSEEQSSVLEEKKNGEMGTKKRHEENCEIEGEIMVKWGERERAERQQQRAHAKRTKRSCGWGRVGETARGRLREIALCWERTRVPLQRSLTADR